MFAVAILAGRRAGARRPSTIGHWSLTFTLGSLSQAPVQERREGPIFSLVCPYLFTLGG
jgi:hypothetical protein